MRRHALTITLVAILPVSYAHGGIVQSGSSASLTLNANANGHTFLFTETFEEGTIPAATFAILGDPLTGGVANIEAASGFGFTTGLDATGMTIQSNTLGTSAATLSPRGALGLLLVGPGLNGTVSQSVISDFLGDSLDLVFDVGMGAIGFDVLKEGISGPVFVQVYDPGNVLLAATIFTAGDPAGTNFFGVTTFGGDTIGRINISTSSAERIGADNIELWTAVPAPGALGLLAVAGLCGGRRRRRG